MSPEDFHKLSQQYYDQLYTLYIDLDTSSLPDHTNQNDTNLIPEALLDPELPDQANVFCLHNRCTTLLEYPGLIQDPDFRDFLSLIQKNCETAYPILQPITSLPILVFV